MINEATITDEQLKDFLLWFRNHFYKDTSYLGSFTISMAGTFHIHPRLTNRLIERCEEKGWIERHLRKNTIKILIDGKEA